MNLFTRFERWDIGRCILWLLDRWYICLLQMSYQLCKTFPTLVADDVRVAKIYTWLHECFATQWLRAVHRSCILFGRTVDWPNYWTSDDAVNQESWRTNRGYNNAQRVSSTLIWMLPSANVISWTRAKSWNGLITMHDPTDFNRRRLRLLLSGLISRDWRRWCELWQNIPDWGKYSRWFTPQCVSHNVVN